MSKKQNLFKLSVTVLMVLVFAVGLVLTSEFIAGIGGGSGGDIGGDSGKLPYIQFADMPKDISGYVEVDALAVSRGMADDASLSSLGFQQSGGAYIIDNGAKFVYALRGNEKGEVNGKTYRLTKDFIITTDQFVNRQKSIEGSTVFDGNGHTVISNILTEFLYSKTNSGGFLTSMGANTTIKNLNYYYSPNSLTSIYFSGGSNKGYVGGFIGYVDNGARFNNCNINIYGSVYALRTATNGDYYPAVGGVFGYAGGSSTNCVFNVVGATISTSSHGTEVGLINKTPVAKRGMGGVAGELGSNSNIFSNCVINVAPSTLIGPDLFGHNSNWTDAKYNEAGIISGATNGSGDSNSKFNNVVLVNYNSLYDFKSTGPSAERYRVPTGFGWISSSNDNDAKIINLKGGSILGEDMVAKAETRDNGIVTVTTQTPYSSYITSGGLNNTNIANLSAGSTTTIEFYQGLSSGQYVVKDDYTWNRLVGLSGNRYFTDDGKYQGTTPFYQSDTRITNSVVENVKFDTASNVDSNGRGRLELSSNAAVGYKLYSTFSGNNGDDPTKNVVVFNNGVTHGPIGIFSGTMRNLGIKVNTSINNKTNIQWYNGGFIDVMRGTLDNCVIDADVNYSKTSYTDPENENMMVPNGITYYGGLFGNISGTVEKCDITVKPSITLTDYRRYQNDNNADAGTQYATQVGGFAGSTGGGMDASGAKINNSIVRVEKFSFTAPQLGSGCISGFIGDVSSLEVAGSVINIDVIGVSEFLGTNYDSNITGFVGYHRAGAVSVTNANIEVSMSGITNAPINLYYSFLMGGKSNDANGVSLTNVAFGTSGYGAGANDKTYLINRAQSVSASNVWVYNMTNDGIKRQGGDTNGVNYISTIGSTVSGETSNVYLPYIKSMTPADLANSALRTANFSNFTFFVNDAHRSSFYDGGVITRAKNTAMTEIPANMIYANRLGFINGDASFDNNQATEHYISSNEAEAAYVQYVESDETFRYGIKVKGSGTTNKNIKAFMSTKYIGNVAQWNQVARNTNNNLTPAWMKIYLTADIIPESGQPAGNFMPMGTSVYTMNGETEVETTYSFNATLVGYKDAYQSVSNNGVAAFTSGEEQTRIGNYDLTYEKYTIKIGNISAQGKRKAGLFGVIGSNGLVKGLNIDGNRIDGISQTGKLYMGTVAGENYGRIEDINIAVKDSATISVNTNKDILFGLIAGENKSGTIKDVVVNVEGSPIVSFANIDRTAIATQSFFFGGAVGWNEGTFINVAINLNNLTFRKGNVADSFTRYYVAGGVGYNNGGALNNFYVSSNRSNFDSSIGIANRVGVAFQGQSTTSYGGVAYLYTPSTNASINIPAIKMQGGGAVTDNYLKTIEIEAQLGAIEDSGRLQVTFEKNNGSVYSVISSSVSDQYAIAGYYGNERDGNTITGGDVTLSGNTSYSFPSLASNGTLNSSWKIRVVIMGNHIASAVDWYYFQEAVNNGSSFKDIIFYVDNDITLTKTISGGGLSNAKIVPIGGSVVENGSVKEYAFEGTLDGNGNTIVLENMEFVSNKNGDPMKEAALFGILKGEIRNINIEVKGSYTATAGGFSIGDGLTSSAVLVADNRGIIDLGTYIDSSYNSVDNSLYFTGSAERRITANPYAGVLTGVNSGKISGKINANDSLTNTRGITLISSASTAYSGVITALNTKTGVIDSVNAVVGSVHLDERTKSAIIAGENKGIISNIIIDAYINLTVGTASSVFKENIYYFVNTYDNADNIENVWIVNRNVNSNILGTDRYSAVAGSGDVFNIMYIDNLVSTSDKKGVNAVARDGSVKFEAVRENFYGYVENFASATEVAGAANGQLSLEGNVKGKVYAVVHATRDVSTVRDLRMVGLLSRGIVRGLQFELVNDLVLTEEDFAAWEPINNFVHILKGRDHTISTVGLRAVGAKPIFNSIDASGGIQNLNISIRANIEATDKYSALVVRENNGTISNVNVTYYGKISAHADNSNFEGVGVIAGINRVNGVITLSSVTLASNDSIFSSIEANYAGAVAGVNNGRIDRTYVNVAANSNISGKTAAGGITGLNAENGVGTIIGLNSPVDATVTLSGNIVAPKAGGVAGINNNIITNVIVDVDNIATQDDGSIFAGIAADSNGYIGSSTVNWNADSLRKNISKAATVAVNASGIIYDVHANVYGTLGAKEIASGFIVNMGRSNINTADGSLEKGYILSATLNVDGSIVAGNDSMQGVAVGFVYDNNATNNSIIVNINGTIGGRNLTDTANITSKASAFGYRTTALAKTNRAVTYIFDPETGTLVKQSLELGDGGSSSEQGIESARIAVYLKNKPIADEAVGMYFEYPATLDIPRSWFIKTNSFSLKLGAQDNLPGVNEFRAVIDKELIISWENDDNDSVNNLTTTRLNISVYAGEEAAGYSRGFKEGELEYVDGKYTFIPDLKTIGQDTNRVVVFSNFKLDIENGEDFSEINSSINEFDLFYDVNINLLTDIVIGVEGQRVDDANTLAKDNFVPFGNMYAFNSIFNGNGHSITIDKRIDGANAGLFGVIGEYGVVNDIIVNVNADIGSVAAVSTGGLAGTINGKVNNVFVKFKNDADPNNLPVLTVASSDAYKNNIGAFAGVVGEKASFENAWVILQNDRIPAVNGKYANASDFRSLPDIGIINLGGVSNDLFVEYVNYEGGNKTLAFFVEKDVLPTRVDPWKNHYGGIVTHTSNNKYIDNGYSGFNVADPITEDATIYTISLIKTYMTSLSDLINFANNVKGFRMDSMEQFYLDADIDIDAASLLEEGIEDGIFQSIGSLDSKFGARLNAQGHTVTIGEDVTIKAGSGGNAGFFAYLASSAIIDNLKLVVKTDKFDFWNYAGSLAGVNEGTIRNTVVEFRANKPSIYSDRFGGIVGNNSQEGAALNSQGVYLVTDYLADSSLTVSPSANESNSIFNTIYIHKPHDDRGIGVDYATSVSSNKITISSAFGSDYQNTAPYFGLLDSRGVNLDSSKSGTTELSSAQKNSTYSMVFLNTVIKDADDLIRIANRVNSGIFNVNGLVFDFEEDIELIGNHTVISDKITNGFRATLNGNGHTVTFVEGSIYGEYAGLIGYMTEEGIVKNITLIFEEGFTVGGLGDGTNVATRYAGLIVGHNYGRIENVLVYDKGANIIGNDTNVIVGTSSGSIVGSVLVVDNAKEDAMTPINGVGVVKLIGKELEFTDIRANVNGSFKATSNVELYVYADSDMNSCTASGKEITFETAPSFISSFDVIISNESEYRKAVDEINSIDMRTSKRTLYNVTFSIDPEIKDNLVIEGSETLEPIGKSETSPFVSSFNGNGKILRIVSSINGSEGYAGVFGYIGEEGSVSNIIIYSQGVIEVGKRIITDTNGEQTEVPETYIGVIAYNKGNIQNSVITSANGSKMSDAMYSAGGIAVTEKMTSNVWYLTSTTGNRVASTTAVSKSGINVMTMVGPLTESIVADIAQDTEVVFKRSSENNEGRFFVNYAQAGVNATGNTSITAPRGSVGLVYEYVNVKSTIETSDDWMQIASDVNAGYPLTNITFSLSNNLTIKASSENMLVSELSAKIEGNGNAINIIGETENAATSDFVLIGSLGVNAVVKDVTFNVGSESAAVSFGYALETKNARGIIVGENNGSITSVNVYVNANVGDPNNRVNMLSAFVGKNNGTISDINMTVNGIFHMRGTFGYLVVENNGNIRGNVNDQSVLNVNALALVYGVGASSGRAAGYAVGSATGKSVIEYLDINVGDGATLQADTNRTEIGGYVGNNSGIIRDGIITFGKIGSLGYYMRGEKVGFFAGVNEANIDNLVAKAIAEPRAGEVYIRANYSNNRYDYNGGMTGSNNFLIVEDSNSEFGENTNVRDSSLIVMENAGDVLVERNTEVSAGKRFKFIAKSISSEIGFNGWYENGELIEDGFEFIPEVASVGQKLIYNVVFLKTTIENVKEWDDFIQLVNGGRDVSTAVFSLKEGLMLTLDSAVDPIGTKEHPFNGKFNGNGGTIVINGGINTKTYTGLFGYAKDSYIANIDVVFAGGSLGDTRNSIYSGILVAYADNTTIARGTFSADGQFNENQTGLNRITNRGDIYASINAGGAVGYVTNGYIANTVVDNYGSVRMSDSVQNEVGVGGLVGRANNSTITRVTTNNKAGGTIVGRTAGGIVGTADGSSSVTNVSVTSFEDKAIIRGDIYKGGVVGFADNSVTVQNLFIKFKNNGTETPAIGRILKAWVQNNADITTGEDINAWIITDEAQSNMHRYNGRHIVRVDNFNDVEYIENEEDNTAILRAVLTEERRGMFTFWHHTATGIVVDESNGGEGILNVDGISPNAGNFDITLEFRNTVESEDHLIALNNFSARTSGSEWFNDVPTIYVTNDIRIDSDLTSIKAVLDGNYKGVIHILAIDENEKVFGANTTLKNLIISARGDIGFSGTKIDENVTLSEDAVYRQPEDVPLNDQISYMGAHGRFIFTNVTLHSTTRYVARTKDSGISGISEENTIRIIGNVPLKTDNNANIEGFHDFDEGLDEDCLFPYSFKTFGNTIYYYLATTMVGINSERTLNEMDFLLDNGFDFDGVTIILSGNVAIGTRDSLGGGKDAAAFNGILDGNGYALTFDDNYNPLFTKVGEKGDIRNFIVYVNYTGQENSSVFQSNVDSANMTGQQTNIIIINTNKDGNTYPGKTFKDIPNTLLIQQYTGNVPNVIDDYNQMSRLWIDMAVYGDNDSLNIDDIIKIEVKRRGLSEDPQTHTEKGVVEFNVWSNLESVGKIFTGFKYLDASGVVGDIKSNSALSTDDLDKNTRYALTFIDNKISDTESWNAIADNNKIVSTVNGEILISNDITLDTGYSELTSVANGKSATINGQGHTVKITSDDNALLNGYVGKIHDVIIDASETSLTAEQIIANAKDKTEFERVIVLTSTETVDFDNSYTNIILGKDTDENTIAVSTKTVSDEGVVESLAFAKGDYLVFILKDGKITEDKYAEIAFDGVNTNGVYTVEYVTEISSAKQLSSLGKADDINIEFKLANDIVLEDNVTFTNNNKIVGDENNSTIDLKGYKFTVNNDETGAKSTTLKNIIIRGEGNLEILGTSKIENVLVFGTFTASETAEIANVWTASKKIDGFGYINLGDIEKVAGKDAYSVAISSVGNIEVTFKDALNEDNRGHYLVSVQKAGEKIYSYDSIVLDSTIGGDVIAEYISNVIGTERVTRNKISNYEAYVNTIAVINGSELLEGKTFFMYGDIDFTSISNVTAVIATREFTLDGGDGYSVIKFEELNSTTAQIHENVKVQNLIIEFHHRSDESEGNIFRGTIGDGVTVITYEETFEITGTAYDGTNTRIIKINHYDAHNNKYFHEGRVVMMNTERDFVAYRTEGEEIIEVTTFNIDELPEGVIDINFYLPIKVTINGLSGSDKREAIMEGNDLRAVLTEDGINGEIKINIANVSGNVFINGYVVDGNTTRTGYTDTISYSYDGGAKNTAISVTVNMVEFGVGQYLVKNQRSEFSLDGLGNDFALASGATSIVSTFVTPNGVSFVTSVEGVEEGATRIDAGEYNVKGQFIAEDGVTVLGSLDYKHTIAPYSITANDITVLTREYARDANGKALTSALIDTDASAIFDKISAVYSSEDVEALKSIFNDRIKLVYGNDGRVGSAIAVKAVADGIIENNFVVNGTLLLSGSIEKAKVSVTLSDRAYTFDPLRQGYNIASDLAVSEIIDGISGDGKGIAQGDIKKVTSRNSYLYIADISGIIEIGEYALTSNIVSDNYDITVLGEPKVTINKADLTVNITENSMSKLSYLGTVKDPNGYFATNITDNNGNAITSMKVGVGSYPIIDEITTVYDGVRIVTSRGIYDITAENVYLTANGVRIDEKNYDLSTTLGKIEVRNITINDGFRLISTSSEYNGSIPSLTTSSVAIGINSYAQLRAEAFFLDEENAVNAGPHKVGVRIISDRIGEDVTEYVIANSRFTYDSELGYGIFNNEYTINKRTVGIVYNNTSMTYGDSIADIMSNMYTKKFDLTLTLKFADADGNTYSYGEYLNVGTYDIVYADGDVANAEVDKNNTIKTIKSGKLTVAPKSVDVVLIPNESSITYGDTFTGFTASVRTLENEEWDLAKDTAFSFEYRFGRTDVTEENVSEVFFTAGTHTVEKIKVTLDSNHRLNAVSAESLTVAPKKIAVTFKSGSISKEYTYDNRTASKLDKLLASDGLVGNDKAENLGGVYTWTEAMGRQNVTLTGLTNANYELAEAVVGENKLNIGKLVYTVVIGDTRADEVKNTTTINFTTQAGGKGDSIVLSLNGIYTEKEVEKLVNAYLEENKILGNDIYDVVIEKDGKYRLTKHDRTLEYVVYAIILIAILVALAMLISSISSIVTMPAAGKRDFNFEVEKNKKANAKLLKDIDKRKKKEYKAASKMMANSAKNDTAFDIEKELFPEVSENNSDTKEISEE